MGGDVIAFLDKFGVAVGGLMILLFAGYKSWLRSGPQVDKQMSEKDEAAAKALAIATAEIEYREKIRLEEKARSDRLEATLTTTTGTLRDMTEVLKDVERELVRIDARRSARS